MRQALAATTPWRWQGGPTPGDPRLWLIVGERLYLFFTPDARDAFADDAERIAAADRRRPPLAGGAADALSLTLTL